MIFFTSLGVLVTICTIGFGLFVAVARITGMIRRIDQGETWIRWPMWIPHRHDWRKRQGWFGGGEHEEHETCMRCRRTRSSRMMANGG